MSLHNYFRICPICNSYSLYLELLCNTCFKELRTWQLNTQTPSLNNYPFELLTLWNWNQHNNYFMKKFVYSLKGGIPLKAFYHKLALELYLKYQSQESFTPDSLLFIPAPAKNPKKIDHASLLAQCLSELTSYPLFNPLRRTYHKDQKKRSRQDRQKLSFEKITTPLPKRVRIIFIDDLVTTGSTVEAAFRALGLPEKFQVWSIAEKQLETTKN